MKLTRADLIGYIVIALCVGILAGAWLMPRRVVVTHLYQHVRICEYILDANYYENSE